MLLKLCNGNSSSGKLATSRPGSSQNEYSFTPLFSSNADILVDQAFQVTSVPSDYYLKEWLRGQKIDKDQKTDKDQRRDQRIDKV